MPLRQYLPFTVLKPISLSALYKALYRVATVLTVYGIETHQDNSQKLAYHLSVATVLTVYGIETFLQAFEQC